MSGTKIRAKTRIVMHSPPADDFSAVLSPELVRGNVFVPSRGFLRKVRLDIFQPRERRLRGSPKPVKNVRVRSIQQLLVNPYSAGRRITPQAFADTYCSDTTASPSPSRAPATIDLGNPLLLPTGQRKAVRQGEIV